MDAMSSSFGEMGNLLKQAQRMQQALEEAREELAAATVEGRAGGGAVVVTVTGDGRVPKVRLRPDVVASGDHEALEDLLVAALRDGIERAHKMRQERMAKVSGGLNLPGLM